MVLRPSTAVGALALLASLAAQGANLYCCQDPATGRRVCSDGLPEQCRGKPYRILDGAGNVIKEVEGALTPEQKAQRAAEAKRQKELEAAAREQRRKDQALLETYGSLQDIENARVHAENEVLEAIRQTEARIAAVRKDRKRWEDEAEFYRKKTLPADVEKGLRTADYEIKAQTELLDAKKREMDLVREKYAEDRRRYVDIVNSTRRLPAPAAPQPAGQ